LLTPDVRTGMLVDACSDLGAECTRVITRERAADLSRNASYFSTYFSIVSRPKSAIVMIRMELCSASSRLSLHSTLRATALTPPPRSSKVAVL
jgi:hypothetical protein